MLPLPTDNLYKFMALAGLLMLGFSIYYPAKQLMELRRTQVQLLGEVKVLQLQASEAIPPSDIKFEEVKTKLQIEAVAIEEMYTLRAAGRGGIVLGLLMTISGFTLWYFRIQKLQDSILAKDAASAKLETSESRPLAPSEPSDVQQ